MNHRVCLALLLPCLALPFARARAQDEPPAGPPAREGAGAPVRLRYDFAALDGVTATYTIETEQRVSQEVHAAEGEGQTSGGGEVFSWTRETFTHTYRRGKNGRGEVVVRTLRIEARAGSADGEDRYDSQEEATPPARLTGLADKLDREVTLVVDEQGEVESVKGVKVSARKSYKGTFLLLPERPVPEGKGWDRLERQPMPPLGTLAYHFRYTLRPAPPSADAPGPGEAALRRVIETEVRALYEGPAERPDTDVAISHHTGGGRLVLDARGLVRESRFESDIELTIRTPAGTQVQRVKGSTVQMLRAVEERGAK